MIKRLVVSNELYGQVRTVNGLIESCSMCSNIWCTSACGENVEALNIFYTLTFTVSKQLKDHLNDFVVIILRHGRPMQELDIGKVKQCAYV